MKTPITINHLTKRFGDVIAVNDVSLKIDPGTFITLLGPSGCGKTTLLRCIAGLEDPDEGEIFIGDKLVFSHHKGLSLPAGQRELGLVFQNYALWPHMTVYKNMAFALEIKKIPKAEIDKRIKESLAEVQMEGYENRFPREMSGGQQQRIALARMLAYRPKVFLMDEPLSNLDARLRMDMRAELKHLHYISGATTVYVTHDQVEALTMSSYIAVMKEGLLQQVDTPERIYNFPANLFVADFIGNPKVNLLEGEIHSRDEVSVDSFTIPMKTYGKTGKVVVAIRPENIQIVDKETPGGVDFITYSVLPSGSDSTIVALRGETEITIKEQGVSKMHQDDPIRLRFDVDKLNLYDKESGSLITG